MTAVYAVALLAGLIAIILWVAAVAVAETVDGWDHVDPDRRFGVRGRSVVGAVAGFGLAGMSSSFAGWNAAAAVAAAVAGAAAMGLVALYLGSDPDRRSR